MIARQINIVLIICALLFVSKVSAQHQIDEQRVKVVLRMVGHEILLSEQDSSSLVLPVVKEEDRYKIEFEKEFQIDPFNWASIIDSVIRESRISSKYIVEIENCENNSIVHSFELSDTIHPEQIACKGRILPKTKYRVLVTFLDEELKVQETVAKPELIIEIPTEGRLVNYFKTFLLVLSLLLLLWFIYSLRKGRKATVSQLDMLIVGKYKFDKVNMLLFYNDEEITLTSKEADLLFLFYSSTNVVLKREDILNAVWGDEGDYVGRTLDVFISKLRKKLSADSNLKIVNVHGVGYKFIVNE